MINVTKIVYVYAVCKRTWIRAWFQLGHSVVIIWLSASVETSSHDEPKFSVNCVTETATALSTSDAYSQITSRCLSRVRACFVFI